MTKAPEPLEALFPQLLGEHPAGCLSLYTAPGPGFDPSYYRGLLKDVERTLLDHREPDEAGRIQVETRQVADFIEELRPPGLPFAFFSSAPDGVFEAIRLEDDVDTRASFLTSFDLDPLRAQMERHPPGVAVVVEKDRARMFSIVLQDVREFDEIRGWHISDTRRAITDSARHREQEHERLNLKGAVDRLMKTNPQRRGLTAIYVAGPKPVRSLFIKEMPEPLRRQVARELDVNVGLDSDRLADELRHLT